MAYRIKLDIFEGPFDLLLYLIKKNEVDIYDIPVSDIAKQFAEYVELIKMLDLEVAGEFIELLAILMHIKARLLLPRPLGVSEEEYEDPRTELVERLIEYKRFKEAAGEMAEYEQEGRKVYRRKYFQAPPKEELTDDEYLGDVSLFDLLLAFKRALDQMPKVTHHEVKKIDVTVEQQSRLILDELSKSTMLLFSELMKKMQDKIVIIVTFLALLEMTKKRQIVLSQSKVFDEIRIKIGPVPAAEVEEKNTPEDVIPEKQ